MIGREEVQVGFVPRHERDVSTYQYHQKRETGVGVSARHDRLTIEMRERRWYRETETSGRRDAGGTGTEVHAGRLGKSVVCVDQGVGGRGRGEGGRERMEQAGRTPLHGSLISDSRLRSRMAPSLIRTSPQRLGRKAFARAMRRSRHHTQDGLIQGSGILVTHSKPPWLFLVGGGWRVGVVGWG